MRGRLFVAAQGVLIVLVVLAPRCGRRAGRRPAWVTLGRVASWRRGWCRVAVAAFPQLGGALTPLPEPRPDAELTTSGLYRWVRHPIYSGVLAMGWGWTLAHPVVGDGWCCGSPHRSSRLKTRLRGGAAAARFVDYADYAARTPRFVPPWR